MQDRPTVDTDELECRLRDGLRRLSDAVADDAPSAATLVSLVEQVKQAERRREMRELVQFLACATVLVSGGLLLLARVPSYYAALQAVLAVPAAGAAVMLTGRRKQVMQ